MLKLNKYFSPVFLKRARKFKSLKRGYYAFLLIVALYSFSFFSEFFINSNAMFINYNNCTYFILFSRIKLKRQIMNDYKILKKTFSQKRINYKLCTDEVKKAGLSQEVETLTKKAKILGKIKRTFRNHRALKKLFKEIKSNNWVWLTIYPYGPYENLLRELKGCPPTPPSSIHWFGTDDRGRDVFARLIYGFRISISFALIVTFICYAIGITIGAFLGYYGGRFDLFMQRFVEIWSSMPFLFTVMIMSSIVTPSFLLLTIILSMFGWMGMTYFIRGEFFREKSKDYVQAAIAIGLPDSTIIFKHILPNSLTPVISFAPFAVVGNISSLVSLDFLGFGLPAPTASWGELLSQGTTNLHSWWLVLTPMGALFLTLLLVSFIGEAVREAFDPKEYSRLR